MAQSRHREAKQGINMKTKKSSQVWVVVEVESGVPVLAEVFANRKTAERRERKLRMDMRQDYDEMGLFEATIVR